MKARGSCRFSDETMVKLARMICLTVAAIIGGTTVLNVLGVLI